MDQDLTQKKLVGIVGGIGSGKSTVAAEFSKLGCAVIDADALVHRLLDEKSVQERVAKTLRTSPFNESAPLNRRRIADLVFDNPENLAKLNSVLHPRVLDETERLIEEYRKTEEISAIILDIPLLIEVGWAKRCDRIIFVECPQKLRYQRIKTKRNLSVKDIKMRENFQISLDKKRFQADTTINNNTDQLSLARQVIEIFSDIVKNC